MPILRNINVIPTYVCTHGTQSHAVQPSEPPSKGVGAERARGRIGSFPTSPTVATMKGPETESPTLPTSLFALTCQEWWQTAQELVLRGNNLLTNI